MSMSARDGILSRPTLKRFLFRYFYRSRPEAFRELGRELSGRILGKGKA
jgi:hypothetical protein